MATRTQGAAPVMAAPELDLDRVPAALRDRPQWLVWRFEQKPGQPKPAKMPYYVSGARRTGTQGDEADRARLTTFEAARQALAAGDYSGLGFAFLPGDGLIGIDLDNVIDPDTGEVQPRAAGIIEACASFTEFSPSGRGVHIYCLGETKSHKSNEIGVEMFCGRQFFTVTGRQFPGSVDEVTAIRPAVVERLHQVIDEARGKPRATRANAPGRQQNEGGSPSSDRDRIESALAFVSADLGYNEWIGVGMALFDALGDSTGFAVWDYWSSKGAKYAGAESLRSHWRSFGQGRAPGGDGVIFRLAMNAGWRPPKAPRAPPVAPSTRAAEPAMQAPPDPGEPPEWLNAPPAGDCLMDMVHDSADFNSEFRRNDKGVITPTLFNTLHVLEGDSLWRGVLAFDQFSYRITKRRPPPVQPATEGEWADIDDVRLQVYLTKTYGFEPRKTTVMDAVMQEAYMHPFHPVREYLDALVWDGTPRLPELLGERWGALYTPGAAALRREDAGAALRLGKYLELAGTKWLVGAVARIFKPGCKLDTMLVFEGGQGDFKSTAIRALFGDEWFSDSKLTIGDKDALAQMQGKWAYEMAEMDAHRKADDTAFKQFITTQVDRVRWHYGKRAEDVPRQCIFVGTTNMSQYGKDETGMRRIWPLEVGQVDLKYLRDHRDQIWAEALVRFREGATWWVDKRVSVLEPDDNPELDRHWTEWDLFDEQGDARQNVDAWEEPIVKYLNENNKNPAGGQVYYTTAQLMGSALLLDKARWTPLEQKRVGAIMRRLGFRTKKVGPKNARVNGWVRLEAEQGDEDVPI